MKQFKFAFIGVFSAITFISLALTSTPCRAEEAFDLISYTELMTLSNEQRVAYLEGVRQIFNEVSAGKSNRKSDSFSLIDLDPLPRSRMKFALETIDRELFLQNAAFASSSESTIRILPQEPILTNKKYDDVVTYINQTSVDVQIYKCISKNRSITPPINIKKLKECDDATEGKIEAAFMSQTPAEPTSPKVESTQVAKQTVQSKKFSCAPIPEVCADPNSMRGQAFAGNQKCVFAGMISHLDSRNRRCEAITQFKAGSATFKCESGQTMCNPMLFGAVSESKPICIGRGREATLTCSKLSSARDGERFLNRNKTGLLELWNEFQVELNSMCKPDTTSAKFHCVECNVMRSRIFELNARILFNPCRDRSSGQDNIGARLRIQNAPLINKKTKR